MPRFPPWVPPDNLIMFIVLSIYKAAGAINTPVVSASEEHGRIKLSVPRAQGETQEEAGVFKPSGSSIAPMES